jgi:hypothetical protein
MYYRATSILVAGLWAMALSAQTPPRQPAVMPQAPAVRPDVERALRELVQKHSRGEKAVCSISPREVRADPFSPGVAKDVEGMPTFRPDGKIDAMPIAMPAPPCEEEKR